MWANWLWLAQRLAGGGQHQFAVFDAPHGEHVVGQMFDLAAAALHDHHFQTVVVIQMYVLGSEHVAMGLVLETIRATISGFVLQLVLRLNSRMVSTEARSIE